MHCFKKENYNEIKKMLRTSCIHDGSFSNAVYDEISKNFTVRIENKIWNGFVDMIFVGISKFLSVADYKWGNNETISCLAVMDGTGELPEAINSHDCTEKLCFVWETFSGNQIFIVCSELIVL